MIAIAKMVPSLLSRKHLLPLSAASSDQGACARVIQRKNPFGELPGSQQTDVDGLRYRRFWRVGYAYSLLWESKGFDSHWD